MKHITITMAVLLLTLSLNAQENVYALNLKSIQGANINLGSLQGKKVIIVVCDAAQPDREYLRSLDTLFKTNRNRLAIIAIPATDFSKVVNPAQNRKLWEDTLHLSYLVTTPAKVKKANGQDQQLLMQWLTTLAKNKHAVRDVVAANEMFVLNEYGRLYAHMAQKTNLHGKFMKRVLEQVPTE
ncbi:MAG: hypothetical protein V4557_09665 [Bacteroidota bacterium]